MGMMTRRNIKRRAAKKVALPKDIEVVKEISELVEESPKKRGRKPKED
jgi:hypothetical protein